MHKKLMLFLTVACICSAAQAENLLQAGKNIGPAVERAVAKASVAKSATLFSRTMQLSRLVRITLAETPAGPAIPVGPALELPSLPAVFSYRPQISELKLLQDFVKENNGKWIQYNVHLHYEPVTFYAFISLVQKDVLGQLSPADQEQLYRLFAQGFDVRTDADRLEMELNSWRRRDWRNVDSPKLPTKKHLLESSAHALYAREWNVAAFIYLAQRVYGNSLPESLQQVNVIPEP